MATISLTLPVSGTVITAGLHSTNYTAIQGAINGGLDTANWATGLIFAPSKIMQEGAARKDGMLWSGALWEPKGVAGVYDRATTTVDVQNSAAETSIYTKSITGNDMGTTKMLRATIVGDYLHNNVAADTATPRVKFGGTTFYATPVNFNNVIAATRHPWEWHLRVANLGATNSQMIEGVFLTEPANTPAPTTGIGNANINAWGAPMGISTLGTIDTTSAQTLDLTVQWSAASANNSFRMRYALLELV